MHGPARWTTTTASFEIGKEKTNDKFIKLSFYLPCSYIVRFSYSIKNSSSIYLHHKIKMSSIYKGNPKIKLPANKCWRAQKSGDLVEIGGKQESISIKLYPCGPDRANPQPFIQADIAGMDILRTAIATKAKHITLEKRQ